MLKAHIRSMVLQQIVSTGAKVDLEPMKSTKSNVNTNILNDIIFCIIFRITMDYLCTIF